MICEMKEYTRSLISARAYLILLCSVIVIRETSRRTPGYTSQITPHLVLLEYSCLAPEFN